MTARITEHDEPDGRVIRLEGSLCADDASIIEGLCAEAETAGHAPVLVDLHAVTFLDQTSADTLRRLRAAHRVTFRGCYLFVERLLDQN
jgi:anti-anti-sigma regulatory factor